MVDKPSSTYHCVKVRLLLGTACCLKLSTLHLCSHHALAKKLFSAKEEFMIVSTRICTPRYAVESVKIELSLKASELTLAEVVGHDMLSELLGLVNHKAPTMRLPSNNVSQAISLHLVKDTMKFLRKGH